jgi:hypothetical protein
LHSNQNRERDKIRTPNTMKTFDFYLDTKVTTWYRTNFEVEANSLAEAKQKAIQFVKDDEQSSISWEQIDETTEAMSVDENGGESTEELYYESSKNLIWDNTKK